MSRAAPLALAGLLALGAAGAPPAPEPSPRLPPAERRREFCSVVRQCALPGSFPEFCAEELTRGAPGVTYDEARCRQPRSLVARGFQPADPLGYPVFRFLGRRYQVVYALQGRAPISEARLSFLAEDLPLACRLASAFQKTVYEAEYLDPARRRFRARKGDTLQGEAQAIVGGPASRPLVFFGSGRSKLGPWTLYGQGFLSLDYAAAPHLPGWVDYRVEVVACPDNGFINFIMSLGPFKSIVEGQLRDTVRDLTDAARKLQAATADPPGAWSPEERTRLEELRALP